MNPDSKNHSAGRVYSYMGQAFSQAFEIENNSGDVTEKGLENLILSIACQELSRSRGNEESENYQAIGREYYDLQHLMGRARRRGYKMGKARGCGEMHFRSRFKSNGSGIG